MNIRIKAYEDSKTKTNGDFLLELYKNEPEELYAQFQKEWIEKHTYAFTGEEKRLGDFLEWLDKPYNFHRFSQYVKLLFKKGDKVKCVSSDPNLAEVQGKIGTVYGKSADMIFVSFGENIDWRLAPSTLVKVGQENFKVKVGDVVCIKMSRMRPGYTADALFKIVWKSTVNVRVIPVNPKYPMVDLKDKYSNYYDKRPGSYVREYSDETKTRHFRKCVYNLDIPIASLVPPDQYDKEDLELVMDLFDIGL